MDEPLFELLEFRFSAPDRLRLSAEIDGHRVSIGRDGNLVWIHAPKEDIGVVAKAGVPRFAADPGSLDETELPAFALERTHLALLPLLFSATEADRRETRGIPCRILRLRPREGFEQLAGFKLGEISIWLSAKDGLPVRLG